MANGYRTRRWAVGKQAVLIPNLLQRQFAATRPNTAWVTDITYIRTWQGWLYLAVVMDLFSRMIVWWAAGPIIHRELVLNAMLLAVRRRRPRRTLIHSDQGTQYGSDAWRQFCRSNHLEPSMSRKGNCWDNAVAESFFSSLKKERIKKQIYRNRDLATADLVDYIDVIHNRTRRHSHLGGLSMEFARGRLSDPDDLIRVVQIIGRTSAERRSPRAQSPGEPPGSTVVASLEGRERRSLQSERN